jgi:hypothetical protein
MHARGRRGAPRTHASTGRAVAMQENRALCPQLPLALRTGLPVGAVYRHAAGEASSVDGTGTAASGVARTIASALRKAADALENAPEAANAGMQSLGLQFMKYRLPLHPTSLPDAGPTPELHSAVCCRAKVCSFLLHSAVCCCAKVRSAGGGWFTHSRLGPCATHRMRGCCMCHAWKQILLYAPWAL